MISRSLGQDPDTPTYMEALLGRVDLLCEDFQRATEEDLVVWKRNPRGLRGHQSVSLSPTGTMRLLFKCGTIVSKNYSR